MNSELEIHIARELCCQGGHYIKAPSSHRRHTSDKQFENGVSTGSTENTSNVFRTLRRRNLTTQQSTAILDLCLKKNLAGKFYDYRSTIVYKKLRF